MFDVIVDDGSHRSADIIQTFEACFDRLAPVGLFIVEDLHSSYFVSHGGGFCRVGAAVEWFKTLADAINADHFEDDAEARVGTSQGRRLQEMGCQFAHLIVRDSASLVHFTILFDRMEWFDSNA